jgi:hypothetical protein
MAPMMITTARPSAAAGVEVLAEADELDAEMVELVEHFKEVAHRARDASRRIRAEAGAWMIGDPRSLPLRFRDEKPLAERDFRVSRQCSRRQSSVAVEEYNELMIRPICPFQSLRSKHMIDAQVTLSRGLY